MKKKSKKSISRRSPTITDPAPISELRRVRRKMLKDAGGTIAGLLELGRARSARLGKSRRKRARNAA